MLATFVIGLREGLEAALIVGIVATFVRQRGRADLLYRVWCGVAIAIGLCLAAAVALQVLNANLPQQQQEALETIVGVAAVAMVSYMIVWMRRHARQLKGQLEAAADQALATGSAWVVAAGLLMTSLHTAHEAGWLNSWQQQVLNLTWAVQPGSIRRLS